MFKLVIQDDEGKTTVVPLIRDEITIGRKEGNTIRLTERNVSRRHARILRNNGEVHIEDLGSYNGIRVNNARIAERVSLRVSDQVQIGDYKLYLKAEGLEQVDDAKTVPIERIGSDTATDVIPAVAPAPTQPMAIPATPSPTAAPQLVGNPARTLVAIADTDPHGRPLASAAVVAALTQAAGYGKLVVLSSNFAGKEYELSRPQMIVGRTDENDIVINHRSISRNHAKLVREPESGRYTISDLQSSNGVRVNGQDYGKVELRRGDVVDLGHVRLRFVEPGEDFVFSRDAVITDVPDAGSRKGLMVAIVLGLIVLAGVTIFFLTRAPGDDPNKTNNNNNNNTVTPSDGPNTQITIDGPDQAIAKVDPPDAADTKVDPPVTPPDAPQDPSKDPDIQAARVALADDKWDAAIEAAERAMARNHPEAKDLNDKAHAGSKAEAASRRMEDALKQGEYKTAARELGEAKRLWPKVGQSAEKTFNSKTATEVARLSQTAKSRALSDETCQAFRAHMAYVTANYPDSMADRVRYGAGTCKPKDKPDAGSGSQQVGSAKPPIGEGSGSATVKPPKNPECTEAKIKENKALVDSAISRGAYGEATAAADRVLACGFDGAVLARGFLAACNGRDANTARRYYKSMSVETQNKYSQICTRNGVTLP